VPATAVRRERESNTVEMTGLYKRLAELADEANDEVRDAIEKILRQRPHAIPSEARQNRLPRRPATLAARRGCA